MSKVTTSIQRLLCSFRSVEALLESDDNETLQVLSNYLVNRRNSELMECILSIRNFTKNTVNSNTVDNFLEFYRVFINVNSDKSLNLPSQVVQQASDLYQQLTACQIYSNQHLFSLKIESIMKSIFILIEYQINIEILPQFRMSTEYSTFILSKVIELGSGVSIESNNTQSCLTHTECNESTKNVNNDGALNSDQLTTTIEQILKEGNMTEHLKSFQKKKLIYLYQIKNFTTQDFKDKIGIKKIGHLKRIVRLVNQHFYKPNDFSL